jgi:hypothetical protein
MLLRIPNHTAPTASADLNAPDRLSILSVPPTMSRPMSMPDFAALLDTSTPLYEARAQNRRQTSPVRGTGHARKKLSISLAAGLMMNHNSPQIPSAHHDLHLELLRNQTKSPEDAAPGSPVKSSLDGTKEEDHVFQPGHDNLFHAYALRVRHSDDVYDES